MTSNHQVWSHREGPEKKYEITKLQLARTLQQRIEVLGQVNVLTLKEHASDLVGSESPYIGSASIQVGNQVRGDASAVLRSLNINNTRRCCTRQWFLFSPKTTMRLKLLLLEVRAPMEVSPMVFPW